MKPVAVLLMVAFAVTGCALSPQTVQFDPAPEIQALDVGGDAPVLVTVKDGRERDVIGTRGGVYADTSLLRSTGDLEEIIQGALQRGLRDQGFRPFDANEDATRLSVELTELSYIPEDSSVVNRIRVAAELRVRAERPDVSYTGRYRSSTTHDRPFTPSARRNEEMLNEVLERSLSRLLADERLQAFLAGEDDAGNGDEETIVDDDKDGDDDENADDDTDREDGDED